MEFRGYLYFHRDINSKIISIMLKDKLNIIKRSTKKLAKEVPFLLTKSNHYEMIRLIGQGTFGKVYLVLIFLLRL